MKTQLQFIALTMMFLGATFCNAQVIPRKGEEVGNLYKVTDTVNGEERVVFYESEDAYLDIVRKKAKKIESLQLKKEKYEAAQRLQLAEQIQDINERVDSNADYTEQMAQRDKQATAEEYAERIAKFNQAIDAQIEFEKVNQTLSEGKVSIVFDDGVKVTIDDLERNKRKYKRTNGGLSYAFGTNFIDGNNLGYEDFKFGSSSYFSIGFLTKTALDYKQKLRLIYGVEYQSVGAEFDDNRSFSTNDPNNTQIEVLPFKVDKAKFRQDQLLFPLRLEFGGTTRKDYKDGRVRYNNYKKWKLGVGGYAGFNMSSRLKLKYELNGNDIKTKQIDVFDNNILLYGVDAYLGRGDISIFWRMALNDVFDKESVDGNFVSLGVRWDLF